MKRYTETFSSGPLPTELRRLGKLDRKALRPAGMSVPANRPLPEEYQSKIDARLPICQACASFIEPAGRLNIRCQLYSGGSKCRCTSLINGPCPAGKWEV